MLGLATLAAGLTLLASRARAQGDLSTVNNVTSLSGTWSSGSGAVSTGSVGDLAGVRCDATAGCGGGSLRGSEGHSEGTLAHPLCVAGAGSTRRMGLTRVLLPPFDRAFATPKTTRSPIHLPPG